MENLKNIEVTGEISLQPYESVSHEDHYSGQGRFVVLIVGPTGAGKSSFVESLAGSSQTLSLSSDKLAGYTQHISAFRVVNAIVEGGPLYLVDTPGFSDSNFSEKEILDMVNAWVDQRRLEQVNRILYLIPINGTRLPGTKRKTIEMLITSLKTPHDNGVRRLTFVTTMWDSLYGERALHHGQSNFEELRDKQLKPFIDDGAGIEKFTNTLLSAIQILDASVVYGDTTVFTALHFRTPPLYRDLCERVENILQEKRNIGNDLDHPEAQTNLNLRDLLERKSRENDKILSKFIRQFRDYGDPPEGFEDAAQRLLQEISIVTNHQPHMRLILREESTAFEVTKPVPSPSIHAGDQVPQTLQLFRATNASVLEPDSIEPELTLIRVITPERHASSKAMLRENVRRTPEGAMRPWKKWFGLKC